MIYGLGVVGLLAIFAGAALALFRSYEKAQQDAIEVLQSEIEEIAHWVDSEQGEP